MCRTAVPAPRPAPPRALLPWMMALWLALAAVPAPASAAEGAGDELVRALAGAEESLRQGELQVAESRYREVLGAGWRILGEIAAAEGRTEAALAAFGRATRVTVEHRRASLALALLEIESGRQEAAIPRLQKLLAEDPEDLETRRLLAAALFAAGRPEQALQELEEARARAPGDPELAYSLATTYLRADRVEAAQELLDEVARQRPIAATHVLLGRTYRDAGRFELAERELRRALALDPGAPRAHFYLGTLHLMEGRRGELEEAIARFRRELEISPGDPTTHLYMGMALVESRRPEEALPHLEQARSHADTAVDGNLFLGRALLATDRPEEAVAALQGALAVAGEDPRREPDGERLRSIHYQLGLALRRAGDREASTFHLETAERITGELTEENRGALRRFIQGEAEHAEPWMPGPEATAYGALATDQRNDLRGGVERAMARSYLNLGLLQARGGSPGRAADLVAEAAALSPDLPGVQRALGAFRFEAGEHGAAVEPLARALADSPEDRELRRMLGLAHLETGGYDEAVELLREEVETGNGGGSGDGGSGDGTTGELRDDPALLYAYALALARSGRDAEAEKVFAVLLGRHGGSARVQVLVGEAHAGQNDFDAAVGHFQRALELDAGIPHARPSLAVIHLRRGELEEAERVLSEELALRPADVGSRHLLATVLDLRNRPEAAEEELRQVLVRRPGHVDARYLLGKVLLAQGATGEAVAQLETAAGLDPANASVHYQLGRAYQAAGDREQAEIRFQRFRELKARDRAPEDGDDPGPEVAP